MQHRIWMVDVAREQCLTRDHLFRFAQVAQEANFTGLGLYLEHRFAYPRTPWVQGKGCLTPESVRDLQSEFPSLQIIPFVNVLSHVEGFIYTEEGRQFHEQLFKGMQACPCDPGFQQLARDIIDDTIDIFRSDLIHIGGDETWQLAVCPKCKALGEGQDDPKAHVYTTHYAPLIDQVVKRGRIPGVWGDMMIDHPQIAKILPKEAIVFDWQYFSGLNDSAPKMAELGYKIIGCPSIQTYNAAWCHTEKSEENVRQVTRDVQEMGYEGVCLTTWECGVYGAYDTLFPAVKWSGEAIQNPSTPNTLLESYKEEGMTEWAKLMGKDLEELGGIFEATMIRSSLKSRLLLYGNPFLLWMHYGEQLAGETGQKAIELCNRAMASTDDQGAKGVSVFVRSAIEFAQMAEKAHLHYAKREPEQAVAALAPTRYLFDTLQKVAKATHERIGGSLADIERAKAAKAHVEKVIQRIRDYGNGELGYLPAFEVITNPKFMPHDQACWWLINGWANE
ncbi:MAG: family 20 glycosylhydrolase [Armatimonadota bacterium]